jgi:hypothetical protein
MFGIYFIYANLYVKFYIDILNGLSSFIESVVSGSSEFISTSFMKDRGCVQYSTGLSH